MTEHPTPTPQGAQNRTLGTATVIRGNARHLPLADNTVDLVVTSPPYLNLRAYQDNGETYDGQIGSEPSQAAFLDALIEVTTECVRVLKPTGSMFVNLGDSYRDKGLQLTPHRYAMRCIDDLGLILRAEIIWSKPNGLPESVTDRVRRSHEQWFHFTLEPRYFSAVDEIREPTSREGLTWEERKAGAGRQRNPDAGHNYGGPGMAAHVLGKLPGSVWTVPTEPLQVPAHLGVDHFAAFACALPRQIIKAWSPSGVCVECGEGRRPVSERESEARRPSGAQFIGKRTTIERNSVGANRAADVTTTRAITGHVCACTPYTDHPGQGGSSRRKDNPYGEEGREQGVYSNKAGEYQRVGPWREYHFDQWSPAATMPAVVLDCFGGTGTTALVAKALGRHGVSVDMSQDYGRLARWRTNDLDQLAKVQGIKRSDQARAADGLDMDTLFDFDGGAA